MTIFGVDLSEHNNGFSITQSAKNGIEFAILRTGDGKHSDTIFKSHLEDANRAGVLIAAYHYIRSLDVVSAKEQVDTAMRNLQGHPKIPLFLDVEAPGITLDHVKAIRDEFRSRGVNVIGVYTGFYYWKEMLGAHPSSLFDTNGQWGDLGVLWLSHYGQNTKGSYMVNYPGDDSNRWGYRCSGKTVDMLQYTSNSNIPPSPKIVDVSAFRGSKSDLARLWQIGEDKVADEKVIPIDPRHISQDTYYNCGPASAQSAIYAATGNLIQESILARELGTTVNGTNWWPNSFKPVLDRYVPGADYQVISTQNYLTGDEETVMWNRIVGSINRGNPCIVDIWSPPNNRPIAVYPSTQSPNYGSGTVMHYLCVNGYRLEPNGDRKLHIIDSGFNIKQYWVRLHNLAVLMVPRGYIYSPAKADEPKEKKVKVPSWINPKKSFNEEIALANIDAQNWETNRMVKKIFDKVFEKDGLTHSDFLKREIEEDQAK